MGLTDIVEAWEDMPPHLTLHEYHEPQPWDTLDDEDEWDECSHTYECCCETCYQNYPEWFWTNEDGSIERIGP